MILIMLIYIYIHIKLPTLYVLDAIFCLSCLIASSFVSSTGIDIDLFFPTWILQTQKSYMMEQICLNRNFCSFTGFLPYLPKPMSAKCINKCHLGKFMSTKFLKTDYLQKFMSILSIFCAGILVWAPKFCSQIYEKHLRKNIIYSNLRR